MGMTGLIKVVIQIAIVTSAFHVYSQNHLVNYFTAIQNNQSTSIEKETQLLLSDISSWSSLITYQNDSNAHVRNQSYLLIARLGQKSRRVEDRTWAVEQLIKTNQHKDSGLVGLVVRELSAFQREDFTLASRDSLRNIVQQKISHYASWLRLIGYIGLKDQISNIRSQLERGTLSRGEKWAANLSLSRMGDESALQFVLTRVKQLKVNDEVIYELFPDLIYTRQPVAIQYLVEVLNNDEPLCESADAENAKPLACGYRIMELLAPVIKGFPLKVDGSGDLSVPDYKVALQQVRAWFKNHADYKILDVSL